MSNMANKAIDPQKEYTSKETAELIGVSSRTVKRYLRDGFLKGRLRGPYLRSGYLVFGWSIIEHLESLPLDSPDTE
jgi:hypothetical protein